VPPLRRGARKPSPETLTVGLWRALATAAAVLAIDRIAKSWALSLPDLAHGAEILPFLRVVEVWNRGVNFGLLGSADLALPLAALAAAVSLAIFWWTRQQADLRHNAACGLVAGGALGNGIDRLLFGAVHDFLNVTCCGLRNPYAFNLADTAIFLGVALLVFRR